jgi:Dynamin family
MFVEKMHQFKEDGESVIQLLDSLSQTQSLPDWVHEKLGKCLQEIREAACQTINIASKPVEIGVMGEFSSGKTLLLGSLIGFADALPISEIPTTGNVTAIHITQQQGLHTTQFNNFTVEYLSHKGVKDCLGFMLKEVEKRASRAGLSETLLKTLKTFNTADTGVWSDILDWCRQAWNSKNPELRFLLGELVMFARAYSTCGTAICGRSCKIDSTTALEGLKLSDLQMNFQNLSFDDLPQAPRHWHNTPEHLSIQDLHDSFPLIRRVDITVKVSKEIWDLQSLQGTNEFVLLDFPGLGAANSGVRDTFLSLDELSKVQTILILLNAKVPGGDRANQIFSMMQDKKPGEDLKDRILVGVSRFDQLPLDERLLDELIGNNGNNIFEQEQLQETSVLNKLNVLKNTIAGAQAFTNQQNRIVLLSSRLKLAELSELSSTLQVGSPEFITELEYSNYLPSLKPLREKWSQVSERLLESNSGSNLGRKLNDFVADGGIDRLRELIEKHVVTHGLEQLYTDSEKYYNALRAKQNELYEILEELQQDNIPIVESSALLDLRQSLQKLITIYREFREDLDNKPLPILRGKPISDVVKEELTFRIYNWREWNLLFDKVKNGIIRLDNTQIKGKGILIPRENNNGNLIPTNSDDFYSSFKTTLEELEVFTHKCTQQAIKDLLNNLFFQLMQVRNHLKDAFSLDRKQLIKDFDSEDVKLLNDLLIFLDAPNQWKKAIVEENKSQDISLPNINPETLFPLARKDKKHEIGKIFDWTPNINNSNPKPANHQFLVLRLRDEIIASTNLYLVQFVSETTKEVKAILADDLDYFIPRLQDLSKREALLRCIATGEEQNQATPQWLQVLAQIALTLH